MARRSLEHSFRPDRPRRRRRPRCRRSKGLTRDGAPVAGLDPAAFKGKVSVVNVWASWCVPCHDEAPLLMELARGHSALQIVGINYKDYADNARRFLGRYGNPFGVRRRRRQWPRLDRMGRLRRAGDLRRSARDGTIAYKLVGPVTPENFDSVLKVEIEKALHAGQ